MTRFSYFVVEYAKDALTAASTPFVIIMMCEGDQECSVLSFLLSEWRARLGIIDLAVLRHITDFIADVRQLNQMPLSDRAGFLDVISGLSAGVLRTTSDGVCNLSDLDAVVPAETRRAEHVACSLEEFDMLLVLLQPSFSPLQG